MTKIWPLTGGIHPPERKEQSLQRPLGNLELPEIMVYSLSQHLGAPAQPIVNIGQRVLRGEKIAEAQGAISAPVHASTSGTVVAIEERPLPHPSGLAGPAIVVEPDGLDEEQITEGCADFRSLDHDTLLAKIRDAGITGMGGASFPTAVKLNPRSNCTIDTLIINGTECEPYITADDVLMQNRAKDLVQGTLILDYLLGQPKRVIIGIEDNKPLAIRAVEQAVLQTKDAATDRIEVVSFPTKYPSGGEKQLIQILTGREVPSGQLPANIGIVMQNVGTTVAVYDAICQGKPLTERITTVVGEALESQRNVRVRLGTPIRHLLNRHGFNEKAGHRVIMGGPMMGFAITDLDAPVVKSTNCLLAPSVSELPDPAPAQACIRCGMCAEACPASLLPQQLFWYAQAEDYDRLEAHNIGDCIECGACAYVCPSNIPLVQYYRSAKGAIRQQQLDKLKSDRARIRFEKRKARMAHAEAEKEAKRLARKKAAEQARAGTGVATAAKKPEATAARARPKDKTGDLVQAAMARATQSRQASPTEQRSRLERTLSSSEERLNRLQQQIAELGVTDEDKRNKLLAQQRQAEVKIADVRDKLKALQDQAESTPLEDAATEQPTSPSTTSPAEPADPVAAAIARAQAKMNLSPQEKLKANIDSLRQRLEKARQKMAAAPAEKAEALQVGIDKLTEKLAAAEAELAEQLPESTEPVNTDSTSTASEKETAPQAPIDPAQAAIERAREKAQAQASMSDSERLSSQITATEQRLEKARQRLQKAESEADPNVSAFTAGVTKIEQKLQKLQSELEELS